ncbi:MAG: VPLPA-CTERM sorting domain-containing protein [Pseudotabrizicola sp.]|uniref:VPLPA-CTERM sorting domain-containing protein n=1 Tax=Pseudotabrizicola sp. TaxID=2939647 RepID=UPI0027266953|nr:VPLPA-CTERM sorting domain-containing protein [Pseudotabrizicola sp.]MDO9640864.1 VPLPA-CTERM sorting domain-containing protein [Pseudotabrizicola sp.]
MLDFIRTTALGAVAALAIGATSAGAVTFAFDSNGGSGTGVDNGPVGAYDFQISLVSNNNGTGGIYTTATGVADQAYEVSGVWQYSTSDVDGSSFDPFGYFIDSVFINLVQLSTNGMPAPAFQNGVFSFLVAAGQAFGFYAYANDGILGSSTSIAYGNLTPVPLPAGGLLLLTALGGVALVRRRNKAAAAA